MALELRQDVATRSPCDSDRYIICAHRQERIVEIRGELLSYPDNRLPRASKNAHQRIRSSNKARSLRGQSVTSLKEIIEHVDDYENCAVQSAALLRPPNEPS
jgi:hypothetical protein